MDYGGYQKLLFERQDHGVLLITLNRPDSYNAADEVMHSELARVWTDVARDDQARVAVVTGAGKAFSAGGDLAMVERMAGDHDQVTRMVTGTEAERIGLVSKCVPREEVLAEAFRVADTLATGPQLAIRLTKRALNGWLRNAGPLFDQSAAYEMLTFMGPDLREGVAALRAKRPPDFPSAR